MKKQQPLHALRVQTAKKGMTVTNCRVEYKHRSSNGTKAVPVTDVAGDGYTECCQELHNLHKQVSLETTGPTKALHHWLPISIYSRNLDKFQAQTGTTYVSQSGKQKNTGRGIGVIVVGGRMEEFRVSWSQTYHV